MCSDLLVCRYSEKIQALTLELIRTIHLLTIAVIQHDRVRNVNLWHMCIGCYMIKLYMQCGVMILNVWLWYGALVAPEYDKSEKVLLCYG